MQEEPCRCRRSKKRKSRLYYQLQLLLVSLGLLYAVINPTIKTWLQEQSGKLVAAMTTVSQASDASSATAQFSTGNTQTATRSTAASSASVAMQPVSAGFSDSGLTLDFSNPDNLLWLYSILLSCGVVFIALILSFKWGRFTAPPPPAQPAPPNQTGDKPTR